MFFWSNDFHFDLSIISVDGQAPATPDDLGTKSELLSKKTSWFDICKNVAIDFIWTFKVLKHLNIDTNLYRDWNNYLIQFEQ